MELKRLHADIIGGHFWGSILVRIVMWTGLVDKGQKNQWLILQYLSESHFFFDSLACLLKSSLINIPLS